MQKLKKKDIGKREKKKRERMIKRKEIGEESDPSEKKWGGKKSPAW